MNINELKFKKKIKQKKYNPNMEVQNLGPKAKKKISKCQKTIIQAPTETKIE